MKEIPELKHMDKLELMDIIFNINTYCYKKSVKYTCNSIKIPISPFLPIFPEKYLFLPIIPKKYLFFQNMQLNFTNNYEK